MKRPILYFALSVSCVFAPLALAQNAFSPAPNRVVGAIDETERVSLKDNVHPLALKQFDHGAAPGSMQTGRIRMVLQRSPQQQRELTQYLTDLQSPASSAYRKWLTPEQFGAAFGVSLSDLLQVQSWLQSHGFEIKNIPAAHNVIEFSGTFDQIQSAFHASIHTFMVNDETHFANVSDPQIPAALAPVISGVGPLNDFHTQPMLVRGPNGRFDSATRRIIPELTLSADNTSYLFVDPADAAIIYDTPNNLLNPAYSGTTYDGTGVTIGIAGASDLTTADVANYRVAFLGEASGSVNLPTVVVDGNDPGLTSAGTEAILDTEVAGGIAPKARIYFYTSADTDLSSGLLNAIFRAVDDNAVSILSVSFSSCEAALGASGNQLILGAEEQAAAQGITVIVSAGDSGSAGCDDFDTEAQATQGFAINGYASTPYAIAVGGTDFDVLSNSFTSYVSSSSGAPPYYATALKYIPENPWNDSSSVNTTYASNLANTNSSGVGNIVAGSGGVSSIYAKPAFQSSITPKDGLRDLPDVSLLAGNGLYRATWVICSDNVTDGVTSQTYTDCQTSGGQFTSNTEFGGVGGTSASAPAFAGMLALAAQAHGSASDNYRLGQADNILYQLAQSRYSTVFHDVTTGNNSVACTSGSPDCGSNLFLTGYNAGTGYDLASGLGSVDAAAMVNNWNSVSLASTTASLKLNDSTAAYTGVHGQPIALNVSVTPSTATGVVGIVDNAAETNGGIQNNGQFAIPITSGGGSSSYNGLPGGTYSVWARYGGDSANAASTSTPPIDVTITPEPSTTTLAIHAYNSISGQAISTTNIPYGSYVISDAQITGTVEGSNTQGVATGIVTFSDSGSPLGSANVSSSNLASWPALSGNIPVLSGGSHQVTANYSGDPSYNASSSLPASFRIVPAATSFFMDEPFYSLSPTQPSATVVFEINTNWNPGVGPTGTVSLIENNQVLASTSNFILSKGSDGSSLFQYVVGDITVQGNQFPAGLNTVTVAYSGDSNYAPSSTTISIEDFVSGGGLTIATPASVTLSPGTTATATLTLTPSGGYTGSINWGCYLTPTPNPLSCWIPATHVPLSDPVDTIVTVLAAAAATPGTYTVNINGSDNTPDGVQLTQTFQVTVASTASPSLAVMNNGPLSFSASAVAGNTSNFSIIPSGGITGQVNLSCSVTTSLSAPQSPPTCTVPSSITLNGTTPVIAQAQVNTTSSTTAGPYAVAVTATSASTSTVTTNDSIPLTVSASPSFSITGSGITSFAVGSGATATFTITPLNGYSGQVNLGCLLEQTFDATGPLGACNVPSTVTLAAGTPSSVNVNVQSPLQSDTGLYLLTLSALDPNSTDLGIDASVDVVVTSLPAFSLSNSGSIQVNAGATTGNTSTINLTPANGFTGTVNLTCAVNSDLANSVDTPGCTLSPAALNVTGASAVTSTLSVSTTAPTTSALLPGRRHFSFGGLAPVLAVVFFFSMASQRRNWMRILGAVVLALTIGAMGCGGGGGGGTGSGGGGGGGNSGTTPGAYAVTVTGTDAATGKITSQTTATLTVN
jgi:trimeric autotransporter adhesin